MTLAPRTRVAVACAAVLACVAGTAAASPQAESPLPARMAGTGGGLQLITVEAAKTGSTTGTLTWWERRYGRWVRVGFTAARLGAHGLVEGTTRHQGTSTTPTGLYSLPFAFGISAAPAGAAYAYKRVTRTSWWCEDNASASYNRWVNGLPRDCAAAESEHLADYPTQYARAMVIGFNYTAPVRKRGAGIFLHVNGRGSTAGCVSVPADAMRRILAWADPAMRPHIAIGTTGGATAITGY